MRILLALILTVLPCWPIGLGNPGHTAAFCVPTAAAVSFPSSGLIHYYSMDNTMYEDTVGSVDLVVVSGDVDNVAGKNNNCARFSWSGLSWGALTGTGTYSIPSAFSISGWVRLEDSENSYEGYVFGRTSVEGFQIGLHPVGETETIVRFSEEGNLTGNWSAGTDWHHYVATASGTTVTLYIDGSQINQDTMATVDYTDWASFECYVRNGISSGIGGYIDEVGIWNRAITLEEVQTIYNGGTGRFYTP